MDLWRLQIFCRVVELRSFSRAADAVFLSQPTVSSHIKDLEDHFSCRLVDRLGREVIPTKAGELLYTYAAKIISLKEETEKALAEFHGKIKGHLTIGGSTIPGSYILPPLLGAFKKVYPEVTITIIQRDSAGVVTDTLEGRVELGIVGAAPHEPRLDQEKVMDDEMFLIVPTAHKWTKRASISMQDLVTEPFVMREPGSGTRKSLEELLEQAGHRLDELNVVAELGSTEAVRQAVKAGVGVSVLPECAVADELAARTLTKVKIRGISFPRSFFLITHKYRTQSPICRTFVDFLRQQPANNIADKTK